jgi:antitoxin component of MazEF toxin-antitoxin module
MATVTLRNWDDAVAVLLPRELIAMLGLETGSTVEVKIDHGSIMLIPARGRYTLAQLKKEHRLMERTACRKRADQDWLNAPRADTSGSEEWPLCRNDS